MDTTVKVELTDIGHGGVAIGHVDGKTVMANFGLPGETVRVRITRDKTTFLRGEVLEVCENPSPYRQPLAWEEAGPGGVGGAGLQHVRFDYQQVWKTTVLRSTLRRIGGEKLTDHLADQGIEPTVRPIPGDDETGGWHTRTRIQLTAQGGRLGMNRVGKGRIIPISRMPLAVAEIEERVGLFDGSFMSRVAGKNRGKNLFHDGAKVKAVAPSGSEPVVVVGNRVLAVNGEENHTPYVYEKMTVNGTEYRYRVNADGFWQMHKSAGKELTHTVVDCAKVESGDHVLELYAGAGLMTLPLADIVGERGSILALEGARSAVDNAKANLRSYPQATARTKNIDERMSENEMNADVIIADPPRTGLGIPLAKKIASSSACRIVLVSCDAASMARDVRALYEGGRRIVSMQALDMFPNTHHFETITVAQ